MKVFCLNCNGIRSAWGKGLGDVISSEKPDFVCFQETKAQPEQLSSEIWEKLGYKAFFHSAEKKGYSGVSLWTKQEPKKVTYGLGLDEFDKEGRSVLAEFDSYAIWTVYFPSGTTGDVRQAAKMRFLEEFLKISAKLKKKHSNLILCGDVNIAHTEIDIHDPKGNAKNSGFLPEERAWVTKFLSTGWVDSFRELYPSKQEYTWWTFRAGARGNNKGWRIDYFFVTPELKSKLKKLTVKKDPILSDHAVMILEVDLPKK
ncbi:exodeoxyribonuclease III [Leptospira hartskeerlii]|uniref:Exodeoxyribonuclease III n=1 Tax=Leptospira hartskeerlii TaxID=2023177 RepID=A0A2M9XF57_9LEPT|nr:exodeoxyribonuclease III [Leptospira hartskeerlii]PJZ26313.1 exodeoxyribonuclease III [Leptospira hartskeerlii]PJZ34397.1 exodeoxyribonuclease III [Leptospira hartskeerlii]